METRYFREFCGATASIKQLRGSGAFLLSVRTAWGSVIERKSYATYQGARIALGKLSGGNMEEVKR